MFTFLTIAVPVIGVVVTSRAASVRPSPYLVFLVVLNSVVLGANAAKAILN